jgi:hypothetical protein
MSRNDQNSSEDGISGISRERIPDPISNTDEDSGIDDISGIDSERISEMVFEKWKIEKKDLRQIAREMNLPIAEVQRILCEKEKLLVREGKLKR